MFKNNRSVILSVCITAAVIVFLALGLDNIEKEIEIHDLTRLQESIQKAAVDCYSVEGFYPASIEHLEENYGVIIDDEAYNVFYQTMGSNIMPDIKVFRKG